jgi:GAF domain-containing protein
MSEQVLEGAGPLVSELAQLREFSGDPVAFWRRYLATLAGIAGADAGVLLRAKHEGGWEQVLTHRDGAELASASRKELARIAVDAFERGGGTVWVAPVDGGMARGVGVALNAGDGPAVVSAFRLPGASAAAASARARELQLVSDVPLSFQHRLTSDQVQGDVAVFRGVLETLVAVSGQERYLAASMTLCDELASRFGCEQVSCGELVNNEYVRLRSISQTSRFDKKSEAVRAIEVAMEEAVDQEEEVVVPRPEGSLVVGRAHEQFARERGLAAVCTVPVRDRDEVVAAVCCERQGTPFTEPEVRQLSMVCELVAGRLMDLRHRDRWFGARWATSLRRRLARFFGPEHTWVKLVLVLAVGVLVGLFAIPGSHRVDASFSLKASQVAQLSAPFDGIIDAVDFEVGDVVKPDQVVLQLDTEELLLERISAAAELERLGREGEKMRAEHKLADMRISAALERRAEATLELIDYRLAAAVVRAPFAGVVVDGDWQEKVYAPVRRGEVLARVVCLDSMYIELRVGSSDIAWIEEGAGGEFAFMSDPATKYPLEVVRIHPVAEASDEAGAVFVVRATAACPVSDWWRPGMHGIAKVDVGPRSLWWIFTHRTADFIRRKLWW